MEDPEGPCHIDHLRWDRQRPQCCRTGSQGTVAVLRRLMSSTGRSASSWSPMQSAPNQEGQEDIPVLPQLSQGHQAGRTPPAGPTAQDGQQDAVGIRVCHGRPPVEVVLRHLGVSCSSMEHPSCLKIWSSMSGRS